MSIDRATRDAKRFVTQGGFSTPLTLTIPNAEGDAIINGIASRHHIEFDQDGYPINSTNAHVLLSENALIEAGLTVRNSRGEVALEGWRVTWTDGTGTARTYKIVQTKPSETLGLIICTIGRYGSN